MEFEFTDYLYVSEEDFQEMVENFKHGFDLYSSIYNVASGWDDEDYGKVHLVYEQLIEKIKKAAKE